MLDRILDHRIFFAEEFDADCLSNLSEMKIYLKSFKSRRKVISESGQILLAISSRRNTKIE
jgi:hypothetical protein